MADTKTEDNNSEDKPRRLRLGRKKLSKRATGRPPNCHYPRDHPKRKDKKVIKPAVKRPAFIPESALKARRWTKLNKTKYNKMITGWYGNIKNWRLQYYRRAEKYHAEYERKQRHIINMKRMAKKKFGFYIPPEGKLLIVVRIRGINRMHPCTRKILQLLRLRQVHNAVFVRVNKSILNMLKKVEPYVTYGTPTLATVRKLLYKRGYVRDKHQRKPITSNFVISKRMRKYGVICIEDMIHEIITVGKHFKEVNNYLWPFKLRAPVGGLKKKGKHFTEGGSAGNRQELIDKLIRRML